ncbi:MAG: LAGLIDADG family homing endonuclease [Nanoarchaeota archaeon]
MKLNLIEYIPNKIVPKKGEITKKLKIVESNDYYQLEAFRCNSILLPKKIFLDERDAISVGLYFAEGYKTSKVSSINNHRGEINFTNSELISLRLFLRFMSKFNIKSKDFSWEVGQNINFRNIKKEEIFNYWIKTLKINPDKSRKKWFRYRGVVGGKIYHNDIFGHVQLSFASVIFFNFFINLINKVFGEAIKSKDKKTLALILKGYFAGDGSVSHSKNLMDRRQVDFLCNDHELRNKLKKSLEIVGLKNLKETDPINTKAHTHSIRIYNKNDFLILKEYGILDLIPKKRKIFKRIINSYVC